MLIYVLFAFLSGVTALIYQVVWTREVALVIGSQIEAISIVLVAFFGGLAAGSRLLGARADRARAPLGLFGALESAGGATAIASPFILQWMATSAVAGLPPATRTLLAGAALLPTSYLIGGTAPALLRACVRDVRRAAAGVGWIVGANTAGAVLGVIAAMIAIPAAGLRATLLTAGVVAIAAGWIARLVARRGAAAAPVAAQESAGPGLPVPPLVAAFVAGLATLAYEVLAARAAALLLGSTLYAWGCVLALLLAGLALGTALLGRRAAATSRPALELGVIESAAALAIAAGLSWFVPEYALPAAGLSRRTIGLVAVSVFPPALLMGGAFPYLVRLSVRRLASLGRAFGTVSAVNTAGGIVGSLLAPFLFLPSLGLPESLLLCGCLNGLLGAVFLSRGSASPRAGWLRASLAALLVAAVAAPAFGPPAPLPGRRVIHVDDGRQASVAVVRTAAGRDLIVDGDPEAGTAWDALETEVLLATLPLVLAPDARDFLEVGLGSGITLGTAARFPLRRIDCVEIARSVISAARFFGPENNGVVRGEDPRVRVIHADGRAYLARHRNAYDVIVANTVHPWSLGATGLYSKEYFDRVRRALRDGGVAAQWVPIARIGPDQIAAIARTFFSVFEEGGVWWGAGNLILVGSDVPLGGRAGPASGRAARELPPDVLRKIGGDDLQAIALRRLASARAARRALGDGRRLTDDRPWLEMEGARRRGTHPTAGTYVLLDDLARAGGDAPIADWIRSLLERARGHREEADRLEERAERAGLLLARRSRLRRLAGRAAEDLRRGRTGEGAAKLRAILQEEPDDRDAGYSLAAVYLAEDRGAQARRILEDVVRRNPDFAPGWNALGVARREAGDLPAARAAFERAVQADPYLPEALANLGLVAAEAGDSSTARAMLLRLRAVSPLGPTPELRALAGAVGPA